MAPPSPFGRGGLGGGEGKKLQYGLMNLTQSVINSDPEILGGTPVFPNTPVPIKTFLDYLKAGDSLDLFLEHFPSVQREQTITVLELVKEMLAS